jgi:hypothetical protein
MGTVALLPVLIESLLVFQVAGRPCGYNAIILWRVLVKESVLVDKVRGKK